MAANMMRMATDPALMAKLQKLMKDYQEVLTE
jgi:hypothetical protein